MKIFLTILLIINITATALSQSLIPYRKDSLWGFCDSNKKIIIKPKYQFIERFSNGFAGVMQNGKYGAVNKQGIEIVEIKYTRTVRFFEGGAKVWMDNLVGVVDTNGKIIIEIKYDDIWFRRNAIAVKVDNKWGFLNHDGKEAIPPEFDDIRRIGNDYWAVKKHNVWQVLNGIVQPVTSELYEDVDSYDDIDAYSSVGLCPIKQNGKWGFMNKKGEVLIKPTYDEAWTMQTEGAWVKKNTRWGLIKQNEEIKIPFLYEEISYFKEGLAYVKLNAKWGYINEKGKEVLPFIYSSAFEFSEGLAEVCYTDDSCGYITPKGETIIPFEYRLNWGGEFREGLAEVCKGDNCGFIDNKGKIVIPIEYRSAYDYNYFYNGLGTLLKYDEGDPATRMFYFNKSGKIFTD